MSAIAATRAHADGVKRRALAAPLLVIVSGLLAFSPSASAATTGAVSTTDNPGFAEGSGYTDQACLNGNGVNCNIYTDKRDVWLSGLPVSSALGAGTYFFSVLSPGGQADPNEAGAENLSDGFSQPWSPGSSNADGSSIPSGDSWTNREFTVDASGNVSYGGTHNLSNNKIQLFPYDDTTSPGGVYIVAVCAVPAGSSSTGAGTPGVDASKCKYDAFKVEQGGSTACDPNTDPSCQPPTTPPADDLGISKDAAGAYTNTYTWGIQKSADKTKVEQLGGGTATFNYTVTVSHDSGTISGVKVTGTIQVFDPNSDASNSTVPVFINGVSDQLSNGVNCSVTGSGPQTLSQFETDFPYECDLAGLPSGELDNTATVSYGDQFLSNGTELAAASPSFTFQSIAFTGTTVDNCTSVTDSMGGSLGSACVGDPTNPESFTYAKALTVPQWGCATYPNVATSKTNTTGTTATASKSVQACGPAHSGALTMGFWQNKNGQTILGTAAQSSLGAYLRTFHPFSDAPSTGLATYVSNIIKAASCTSTTKTCNSMLRAQMLATALDVYFSDPALGGNKIGAYDGLGSAQTPIGAVSIDLTKVCQMIDGTGGTGSCSGSFETVSSAFGGASSLSVSQMLTYANTADPALDAGAAWYGQIKATQVLAKDAFDAINNQVAFGG